MALYDVVVADARAPRDGRFIERIGRYNPNTDPATVELNEERAFDWVMKGAQPTDTVRAMLSYRGIMLKKHLQVGVNKGAITQEEADKKVDAWKQEKEAKIVSKQDRIAKDKAAAEKAISGPLLFNPFRDALTEMVDKNFEGWPQCLDELPKQLVVSLSDVGGFMLEDSFVWR